LRERFQRFMRKLTTNRPRGKKKRKDGRGQKKKKETEHEQKKKKTVHSRRLSRQVPKRGGKGGVRAIESVTMGPRGKRKSRKG